MTTAIVTGTVFLCLHRDMCGTWDSGCTREKATPGNCAFIRAVEMEKRRVEKELLGILNKKGKILHGDPLYLQIKTRVKHITLIEFEKIENVVIDQRIGGILMSRKKRNHYFAK